jgi:hypothetical protein
MPGARRRWCVAGALGVRHSGRKKPLRGGRMRVREMVDFAGIAAPRRSGMPVRIEMNQTICMRRRTLPWPAAAGFDVYETNRCKEGRRNFILPYPGVLADFNRCERR